MKIQVLVFTFFISCIAAGQSCPKYGSATDQEGRRLNRLKNRSVVIHETQSPEYLALNKLIISTKRNDRKFWNEDAYVYTEGYLVSEEEQGAESCNCKLASKKKKNGDVHIYMGLVKDAPKKNCIVVEITPAFKKANPEYASLMTVNSKVRIYGYLFYDLEHENASFTTCKKCEHIWRRTCWEIHPITQIELLKAGDEDN